MTTADARRRLDRLYDSLARFHWWRHRLSGRPSGEWLEMHKRLRDGTADGLPAGGCAGLDDWLFDRLHPAPGSRVLDLGCGFGASLLRFAARREGDFTGVSRSAYQTRHAAREARRRGLGASCTFVQQGFDDPLPGTFDVVLSIETLLHAEDLARTLHHVAAHTRPGGRLALVEDMAADAAAREEPAARELLARWASQRLPVVAEYRAALQEAGFALEAEVDLTASLDLPAVAGRSAREKRLARLRAVAPFGRPVLDAFLGGIAMEKLYDAGFLTYRAMFTRRR